jgi:hypothetical protein
VFTKNHESGLLDPPEGQMSFGFWIGCVAPWIAGVVEDAGPEAPGVAESPPPTCRA